MVSAGKAPGEETECRGHEEALRTDSNQSSQADTGRRARERTVYISCREVPRHPNCGNSRVTAPSGPPYVMLVNIVEKVVDNIPEVFLRVTDVHP